MSSLLVLGITATSFFYLSILVIFCNYSGRYKLFSALQVLGRMALTNYLLISAFLIILLYGVGLGYLGELSAKIILILAFLWLFTEIVISTIWLKYFRYGLLEWVWRQLIYWKRLPLRKK